jgi:hypothetical protein
LNFFYRDLPHSWYEQHFAGASPDQARVDISPNYMVLPGVADRMRALLPDARLICILREPVARAASQYRMAVKLGNIPKATPLIEAFRRNLQFIRERGQYVDLLERFTPYYPLGRQLKTLFYDDLTNDPVAFLQAIYEYIGVSEKFMPQDLHKRVDAGETGSNPDLGVEDEMREFYGPHVKALERYLGCSLHSWR